MTTTLQRHRPRPGRRPAAVLAALLAVFVVGACSGGGADSESDSSQGSSADSGVSGRQGDPTAPTRDSADSEAGTEAGVDLRQRAVISTGTVTLESDDVAQARFEVQRVVDEFRGQISEEDTRTDRAGEVQTSRLVLRVPSKEFDAVLAELGTVAELRSATRSSEDVTTQVIDIEARIRAQTKSLERIEDLLVRAQNLGDIVAIETQLTRRQADLDSLKAQQAHLADQTSLSTITVNLEREDGAEPKETEQAGFLAGLKAGWDGLVAVATAAATALGVVLPFTAVLLAIGLPLWVVLRGRRSARTRSGA